MSGLFFVHFSSIVSRLLRLRCAFARPGARHPPFSYTSRPVKTGDEATFT
jgi:hypothetical protein